MEQTYNNSKKHIAMKKILNIKFSYTTITETIPELTVEDNDYDTVVKTIEKLNPKYRNVRLHYFEDA